MKRQDNRTFDDRIKYLKDMGDQMVNVIRLCHGQCDDVVPDGFILYKKEKLSRIIRGKLNERS